MNIFERIDHDIETFAGKVNVNVSGGAASSCAWHRCLEWWGKDRVVPVFADTCSESPETYDFLRACEAAFGQRLVVLWTDKTTWEVCEGGLDSDRSNGANIWECFHEKGVTRLPRGGCWASHKLKQQPLDDFFHRSGCHAIAVGMQSEEIDRVYRLDKAKDERCFSVENGGKVLYPCIVRPSLARCDSIRYLQQLGIETPKAYVDGFNHNNCMQFGCILAGNEQWVGLLEERPEAFARSEAESEKFREKTGYALCKDRRGGVMKPMTLVQIREEYEAGERFAGDWQSTCGCMQQGRLFE